MYHDAARFGFVARLEENWRVIRQEMTALGEGEFMPWPERSIYGEEGWRTFGLYAFGQKQRRGGANSSVAVSDPIRVPLLARVRGTTSGEADRSGRRGLRSAARLRTASGRRLSTSSRTWPVAPWDGDRAQQRPLASVP